MRFLLDTCAVIWAVSEPENLPDDVKRSLTHPDAGVFVSVISCAEIACAVERGRIELDRV